jgi:DNA-binding transcriptional ArsR family regulator
MPALDDTFAALADPTRRRVVDLLRSGPLRAGELAEAVEMSPPAMSRHLRVLRASGLVEESASPDDARVRIYTLRREPFEQLHGWLDEVEGFWLIQMRSFRAHAEKKARAKRGKGAAT